MKRLLIAALIFSTPAFAGGVQYPTNIDTLPGTGLTADDFVCGSTLQGAKDCGFQVVPSTRGGTGVASPTANAPLYGNGSSPVASVSLNGSATPKYLYQISGGVPVFKQVDYSELSGSPGCGSLTGDVTTPSGCLTQVNGASGAFVFGGTISPTTITTNQNDYNPAGLSAAVTLRITASGAVNITGISGGSEGRILVLLNVGSPTITLKDSNTGSSAGNRFLFSTDQTLNQNQAITLRYDSGSGRWMLFNSPCNPANNGSFGCMNAPASPTAPHNFLVGYNGSAWTVARPACADLSDSAASCSTDATNASNITSGTLGAGRLPNPSASTLGGIESYAAVSHQFINAISTGGVPSSAQPAFGDLTGSQTCAQRPAETGDVTSPAGSCASTVAKIQGVTVSGTTGTSKVVFSNSPIFSNSGTTIGDGTAGAFLTFNGASGFGRTIQYQTAGSVRWTVGAGTVAESGSNAGSNYLFNRWDDSGSFLDTPLQITRSSGLVTILDGVSVTGAGGTCTNQFVRSVSTGLVATCNAVAPADLPNITPTGGTTARSIPDQFGDFVDAKGLGLKGDGSTDDRAVLQTFLDSKGGIPAYVFFPSGTYILHDITLNSGRTTFYCQNNRDAILKLMNGANSYLWADNSYVNNSATQDGAKQVLNCNINLNGANQTGTVGGMLTSTEYTLKNNYIQGAIADAFVQSAAGANGSTCVTAGGNDIIQLNRFVANQGRALAFYDHLCSQVADDDIEMNSFSFNASPGTCDAANTLYQIYADRAAGITIKNNFMFGATGCGDIYLKSLASNTVSGNRVDGTTLTSYGATPITEFSFTQPSQLSEYGGLTVAGNMFKYDATVLPGSSTQFQFISVGNSNPLDGGNQGWCVCGGNDFWSGFSVNVAAVVYGGTRAATVPLYDQGNSYGKYVPVPTDPNIRLLPYPSTNTLGGLFSSTAPAHQFVTGINAATAQLTAAQPAFTDLSGSLGCLQFPALIGDVTTAAGACNTTAVSASGAFAFTGTITPATISSDQNDYNPAGLGGAFTLRLAAIGAVNITGLAGGTEGRLVAILNSGSPTITLKDSNTGSSAANRFNFSVDQVLNQNQAIVLRYDSAINRWSLFNSPCNPASNGSFGCMNAPPTTPAPHNWLTAYNGTTWTAAQPAFTDLSGVAAIAQGGTGAATAQSALANLTVESSHAVSNSDYSISTSDTYVYTTITAFTAPHTWTLPLSNSVNSGHQVTLADSNSEVGPTNTLTITVSGGDVLTNGTTSTTAVLSTPGSEVVASSNGNGKWFVRIFQGGLYLLAANNLSEVAPIQARSNLGLGTSATINVGTSGAFIPLMSTANAWSSPQAYPAGTALIPAITFGTNLDAGLYDNANDDLCFAAGDQVRACATDTSTSGWIFSDQNAATTSPQSIGGDLKGIENIGSVAFGSYRQMRLVNDANPSDLVIAKSRSINTSGHSKVLSNDVVGRLVFAGDNGTNFDEVGATFAAVAKADWLGLGPTDLSLNAETTGGTLTNIACFSPNTGLWVGITSTTGVCSSGGGKNFLDLSANAHFTTAGLGNGSASTPALALNTNYGLFYDSTNTGVGVAVNGTEFGYFNGSASTFSVTGGGNTLTWQGEGSTGFTADSYSTGNTAINVLRRSRGTIASPSVPLTNDILGTIRWRGWVSAGGTFGTGAQLDAIVREPTWSSTALGTRLRMEAPKLGSTTLTEFVTWDADNGENIEAGTSDAATYCYWAMTYGGNSHKSQLCGETQTGVSTAPRTIFITPQDGADLLVCGSDGTNKFCDKVFASTATIHVYDSETTAGTPAARTYTNAGSGNVQVSMGSGTYSTNVTALVAGQR